MPESDPLYRGRFSFGRPNTARPMRGAVQGRARALVVGVYPSAFHIAWTPPAEHDPRPPERRNRPYIASLAVDVEPVVFWDGASPTPADELARWRQAAAFDANRHGSASVGTNGRSGAIVVTRVLRPLGLEVAEVAFTDVVPWFFVKYGQGSQGEALAERFSPVAAALGLPAPSLPRRPSARALVEIATSEERGPSLRSELLDADAPLIITLGQEALDAVRAVADRVCGVQETLAPEGYAAVGDLTIDTGDLALLPLVHPGFDRQTTNERWIAATTTWRSVAATILS